MTSTRSTRTSGHALLWRLIGYAADRGLGLVRTLILVALLAPEDFGVLAVAAISIDLLMASTEFGSSQAVIHMSHPEREDFDAVWTIRLGRAVLVSIVAVVAAPLFAAAFGESDATGVLRLIAVRPLIDTAASIGVVELQRRLDYRPLALIGLARSVVDIVVAVALARSLGVYAMVYGQLAGAAAGAVVSQLIVPWRPHLRRARRGPIIGFAKWTFVAGMVGIGGTAALQAIVSNLAGTEALGRLYLALRAGLFVATAVATIIGDVGLGIMSRLQHDDAATALTADRLLIIAGSIMIPSGVLLATLATPAIDQVLGAEWSGTGRVLALVAIAAIPFALTEVAHPVLLGRGRPRTVTMLDVIRFVVLLGVALAVTPDHGASGAAMALLAGETVALVSACVVARRHVPGLFEGWWRLLTPTFVATALGASLAASVANSMDDRAGVILAALVGVLVALAVGFAFERRSPGLGAAIRGLSSQVPSGS